MKNVRRRGMHWVVRYNAQNTLFHELKNAPPKYEGECTLVQVSSIGSLSLPNVATPIYMQLNKAVNGVEIKSYRYQIYADKDRDKIEQTNSVSSPMIMRIIEAADASNPCGASRKRKTEEVGEGSVRVGRKLHKKANVEEGAGSAVVEAPKDASCDSISFDFGSDMSDY